MGRSLKCFMQAFIATLAASQAFVYLRSADSRNAKQLLFATRWSDTLAFMLISTASTYVSDHDSAHAH